jgi:hypothetical protein
MNQTLSRGGVLLIMAGLVRTVTVRVGDPVMAQGFQPYSLANYYAPIAATGALVLAACVVLALGVRGGGSIVGKSVWGRGVLIGFGVCAAYMGMSGVFGVLGWAFWAQLGVLAALLILPLAIAAVLAIAWERALPGRWWLLPAVALGIDILLDALYQLPVLALVAIDAATIYDILSWVLLGILAVVLARRISTLTSRPRLARRPPTRR